VSQGDDKTDKIVPSGTESILKHNAGLVRRGLLDLAALTVRSRKRIILADDEEIINEVYGEFLTSAGYEVRTTTHPSEVVALVEEFRPDLAFIKLIAPEIDGVKLSEKLSVLFPTLKIVLIGAHVVDEGILQAMFDRGIKCDVLAWWWFDRQTFLAMTRTWMDGSDHIDWASRLRDGKHFEFGLGEAMVNPRQHRQLSVIFIELIPLALFDHDNDFLRALGGILGRFASRGFAYRHGPSQFAMLLPGLDKQEACDVSRAFILEATSLIQNHRLLGRMDVSACVVHVPDDAQSVEQVWQIADRLNTIVKETGHGGVAAWGLGLVQN
jgi:CheY-like chemotaxis protein/GGDEF domain-containing protein